MWYCIFLHWYKYYSLSSFFLYSSLYIVNAWYQIFMNSEELGEHEGLSFVTLLLKLAWYTWTCIICQLLVLSLYSSLTGMGKQKYLICVPLQFSTGVHLHDCLTGVNLIILYLSRHKLYVTISNLNWSNS